MKTGIVCCFDKGKAIIMLSGGEFATVAKKADWRKGDVVTVAVRRVSMKALTVAAACLIISLFTCFGGYKMYFEEVSTLSIDVNPSIEMGLNSFDNVIRVSGFNEASMLVLESVDIINKQYANAVGDLFACDSMSPYMAKDAVYIKFAVYSENPEKCEAISGALTRAANSSPARGPSLTTDVEIVSRDIVRDAKSHQMTPGKYLEVLSLKEAAPDADIDDYRDFNIREIRSIKDLYASGAGYDSPRASEASGIIYVPAAKGENGAAADKAAKAEKAVAAGEAAANGEGVAYGEGAVGEGTAFGYETSAAGGPVDADGAEAADNAANAGDADANGGDETNGYNIAPDWRTGLFAYDMRDWPAAISGRAKKWASYARGGVGEEDGKNDNPAVKQKTGANKPKSPVGDSPEAEPAAQEGAETQNAPAAGDGAYADDETAAGDGAITGDINGALEKRGPPAGRSASVAQSIQVASADTANTGKPEPSGKKSEPVKKDGQDSAQVPAGSDGANDNVGHTDGEKPVEKDNPDKSDNQGGGASQGGAKNQGGGQNGNQGGNQDGNSQGEDNQGGANKGGENKGGDNGDGNSQGEQNKNGNGNSGDGEQKNKGDSDGNGSHESNSGGGSNAAGDRNADRSRDYNRDRWHDHRTDHERDAKSGGE